MVWQEEPFGMWRRESHPKKRDDRVREAIASGRYGLDGEDHDLWVRAWSSMPSRRLLQLPKRIDLRGGLPRDQFGELVSVTITEVPTQFLDWLGVGSETCLVCDQSTVGSDRLLVSVLPTFACDFAFIRGAVWVHAACFARCPGTGEPGPVPW